MPEKFALQLGCVKVINDQVGTVVGERLKRTPEEAFVEWCFAVQMYGTGGCCIKERKKEWTNLQPANRLQQNYKTLYKCLLEDSVGLIRQPDPWNLRYSASVRSVCNHQVNPDVLHSST
ncbi:hypothetical protein T01_8217 [Trichinella spiralis]|uniref:Uncharacterized protein n=1 Tax=Trichinella spiralis TaxID=6334 RepID=A0A0V1AXM5_TRISP|nr:hypothetical protein T01_8217 [Trichinella spiralis]